MENNQDNINQTINNNEHKKKKGHGPLYWVIVIIGITFIMYMSILIGEKLSKTVDPDTNIKEESNNNSDSNTNSNNTENKEVKITDKVKIQYLQKYVAILENLNLDTSNIKISSTSELHYFMNKLIYAFDKLEKKDITTENATTAIVSFTENKNGFFDKNELASTTIGKFEQSGDNNLEFEYVSVDDIKQDYTSLFGFDKVSTKTIAYRCEDYIYDEKINAFVMYANGCGTAGPIAVPKTYIYDITEDNNNVYVYLAYGVSGVNEKNQYVAYTDYTMNKKYTSNVTKDFTINESNYQDFSKYKYTFTKNNDGTYTFSAFNLLK